MGGVKPQSISRVGQRVLAMLMECQIWYPPAGYVALWGKGFSNRTMASAYLSV